MFNDDWDLRLLSEWTKVTSKNKPIAPEFCGCCLESCSILSGQTPTCVKFLLGSAAWTKSRMSMIAAPSDVISPWSCCSYSTRLRATPLNVTDTSFEMKSSNAVLKFTCEWAVTTALRCCSAHVWRGGKLNVVAFGSRRVNRWEPEHTMMDIVGVKAWRWQKVEDL